MKAPYVDCDNGVEPSQTARVGRRNCLQFALQHESGHIVLQVIPMDAVGFHEAFNIRVDELQVLDVQFLYGWPRPTVALLYQDNKNTRHLKTYEISLTNKVPCSRLLLPLPPTLFPSTHRPPSQPILLLLLLLHPLVRLHG